MDKDELDDLLSLDLLAAAFMNGGSFFISGSVWLGIEKLIETHSKQPLPPVFWFCAAAFILGCFLVAAGVFHFRVRRNKITRIFSQTTVIGTTSALPQFSKAAGFLSPQSPTSPEIGTQPKTHHLDLNDSESYMSL